MKTGIRRATTFSSSNYKQKSADMLYAVLQVCYIATHVRTGVENYSKSTHTGTKSCVIVRVLLLCSVLDV